MLTFYTRTNPPCQFCMKAKALAEQKDIAYRNIDIGNDITLDEFKQQYPQARSVPLIVDGDTVIGGFLEFQQYVAQQDMKGMTI